VCPADEKKLAEIETLIELTLPRIVVPGYEEGTPLPARYRESTEELPAKKHVDRRKGKPSAKRGQAHKRSGGQSADKPSYASRRGEKKR
jgi:hypothetical protein